MSKAINVKNTAVTSRRRRVHAKNVNRSVGGNIAMALFLTVVSVFMIFPMAYSNAHSAPGVAYLAYFNDTESLEYQQRLYFLRAA